MQSILTLELPFKPVLADVRVGHNAPAMHAANAWHSGAAVSSAERLVLCWGAAGTGKTWLCQALSSAHDCALLRPDSSADAFDDAFDAQAVVIDNVHALNAEQAIAAFNLYNHIRASPHKRWWATSRVPPNHMTGVLPDLASRLAWGLVFELLPLPDEDSVTVLQAQAARLGFDLSAETAQYLLVRLERNLGALAQHMSSLNRYALTLKKPISNHLVQQWYAALYLPALAKTA
jgi:DnaA-homolog protein